MQVKGKAAGRRGFSLVELSVVVIIGGMFDIRRLFQQLHAQAKEQAAETPAKFSD